MQERRRTERIRLSNHLVGRIGSVGEALVVDISTGGALVEIDATVNPEQSFELLIPIDGDSELQLESRVQRCKPSGISDDGSGRSSVSYRAALEFRNVDSDTVARLGSFLDRLKKRDQRPTTERIAMLSRHLE